MTIRLQAIRDRRRHRELLSKLINNPFVDGYFSVAEPRSTLRDEFAGKALLGMLANQHPYAASDEHMFARDAYVLADAMLKARKA